MILAPGEEENLEFEEDEEGGAGAGPPDSFSARVPGTLLPRLPSEPGMTLLTIRIEKIGLKDAGQCIDPYITVSVKGQSPACGCPSARHHAAFHLEQVVEPWLLCL